MLHRLFLLLFECGLSHDASHVVWAVVKYPSPSPQLHHRGQTASLQRVPRDQRCLQLAKISLPVFFMLLRLCWTKFHLNQTLRRVLFRALTYNRVQREFWALFSHDVQQHAAEQELPHSHACPAPQRLVPAPRLLQSDPWRDTLLHHTRG